MMHSCVCTLARLPTRVCYCGGKMQSTGSSRGFFGCTRSSLIRATLILGTMAFARAQEPPSSSTMTAHAGAPTSLRDLVQEAEQKNPQIAASFHGWQASRNVPKQVSALPETQLSVQQFSVGSPRPFAGYRDRKSTRLNSSHVKISYAVFCLKKKNTRNLYV